MATPSPIFSANTLMMSSALLPMRRPSATNPRSAPNQINALQVLTEDAQWTDEWGTEWRHSVGGIGAITVSHPLHDWSQLDAYLAGQMPDPLVAGRLDGAIPALQKHGVTKYVAGMTHLALFERLHCLRGMQQTFEDFHLFPGEVDRLLDALTDYLLEIIRAWGKLGGDGGVRPDGWFLTDDWGTQASLMISPRMWRKFFAARYRRICDEAHRWGLDVIFHSCGNVTQIVGDLIDAGVDVLDPLQPEAMDHSRVSPGDDREFPQTLVRKLCVGGAERCPVRLKRLTVDVIFGMATPRDLFCQYRMTWSALCL